MPEEESQSLPSPDNAVGDGESAGEGVAMKRTLEFQRSSTVTKKRRTIPSEPAFPLGKEEVKTEAPVEFITAISNSGLDLVAPVEKPKLLVIPLNPEDELRRRAEQEILDEIRGVKTDNGRVIALADGGESGQKRLPLLLASISADVREAATEEARFQRDLDHRAEDVDFRSDVYAKVPIEEFGAALLRGMGWTGTVNQTQSETKPTERRDGRLGLGAASFLPLPGHTAKNGAGNKPAAAVAAPASSSAAQPLRLTVGAVVILADDSPKPGRRAIVDITLGVPGLNKIRVHLEDEPEVNLDIDRKLVKVVENAPVIPSPLDLQEVPLPATHARAERRVEYAESKGGEEESLGAYLPLPPPPVPKTEKPPKADRDHRSDKSDRHNSAEHTHHKHKSSSKHDVQPPAASSSSVSAHSTNNTNNSSISKHDQSKPKPSWVRPQIHVKIVDKKVGGSALYLQKAVVEDVPAPGRATLRTYKGQLVEDVKEKYLETVLPSLNGRCMVLRGEYKGQIAHLVERRDKDNVAFIQFEESLDIERVDMDDIAAI